MKNPRVYRLLSNGKVYRIQRRYFGFWWRTIQEIIWNGYSWYNAPREFDTKEEAVEFLKERDDLKLAIDQESKWVVVDSSESEKQ